MTNAEYQRARRAASKAAGKCQVCHQGKPRTGVMTCDACLQRIGRIPKKQRTAADRRLRRGRQLARVCCRCGSAQAAEMKTECQSCLDVTAAKARQLRQARLMLEQRMLQRWADDGGKA